MSTEPFIGEVKLFGFYFAPLGYMTCQGQLVSIAQYTALFALIGTTYGGDGQTTFALPDLQGRFPNGQGSSMGAFYDMGQKSGNLSASISTAQLPPHVHTMISAKIQISASNSNATGNDPDGTFPAVASSNLYADAPSGNVFTGGGTLIGTTDPSGSSLPIPIQNPYLCMNFSMAIEGIFPSRN